ncbi:hypothetical protein JRO89_XS01G0301500 [Xanthoceras sorbifolium]|uniref:BZIP domain-containing protein n=1 Tax=Xanthoceras sorbifolium TaxID=99658 RepID=A0ABQ8IM72_9ROSI|nr:hypothetical protein JRO89_XS01G0301500 [Xanthoceras sorbifolium]
MCINSADLIPSSTLHSAFRFIRPTKRHNLLVRRLNRRRSKSSKNAKRKEKKVISLKAKMELKNLRLYKENQSIIQENEKLRKTALLLHQENQALLTQLQNKFPYSHNQQLTHKYYNP